MTKCWSQDADDRPSMDEVVNQLEMLYSVCPQPIQPLEYTPQEDGIGIIYFCWILNFAFSRFKL